MRSESETFFLDLARFGRQLPLKIEPWTEISEVSSMSRQNSRIHRSKVQGTRFYYLKPQVRDRKTPNKTLRCISCQEV